MSSKLSVKSRPKVIKSNIKQSTLKIPLKKSRTSVVKKEKKKREPKIRATKNRVLINALGKFEQRKRKIRNLSELCSLKAGELFSHVFKLGTQATFTYNDDSVDIYSAARNWFERADATQQCENTAPGKKDHLKQTDLCYICGLPLILNGKQNGPLECEHILPVAQACLFLDLYRSEYKNIMKSGNSNLSSLEQQIKQNLSVEYNWSHQCCNQIKSSISFVKFDEIQNKFVLDMDSSTKILKGIFYGKMKNKQGVEEDRKYCKDVKIQLLKKYGNFNSFLNERLEIRQKQYTESLNKTINPILVILNANYKKGKNKGFYFLSILSNLILAADSTLLDAAIRSSTGNGIIIPPPDESDEKMKVYTKLSVLFTTFFLANGLDVGRDREKRVGLDNDLINLFLFRPNLLKTIQPVLKNSSFDSTNFTKFIMKTFLSNTFLHQEQSRITYSTLYRNLFSMLFFMKESNDQISATKEAGICLNVILISLVLKNVRVAKDHAISFQLKSDGGTTEARQTLIKLEELLVTEITKDLKKMKEEDKYTESFRILLSVYGYVNSNSTAELDPFFKDMGIENVEKYEDMDNVLLMSTTKYYEQFSDDFEIKDMDTHEISKLEVGAARAFSNIHADKSIQYDDVASIFEKPTLPETSQLDILSSAAEMHSVSNILSKPAIVKRERSVSVSMSTDNESIGSKSRQTRKRKPEFSKGRSKLKRNKKSTTRSQPRDRSSSMSEPTSSKSDVEHQA